MKKTNGPKRTVKTAETVFGIIEAVHTNEGASVAVLAEELGHAKSTVHDHLRTLEDLGYVVKIGENYYVSLRFLDHGIHALNRLEIAEHGDSVLEQLSDDTSEVAWLIVEEHGEAVYIDQRSGERAVPTYGRIGRRAPLHCLAAGKAILSHMPESERERVIHSGLDECTRNAITDPEKLRTELAEVRERGFAYNNHEITDGVRAVGAPVIVNGTVEGGISVSGPANRMKGKRLEETIPDLILAATNEVELKMSK